MEKKTSKYTWTRHYEDLLNKRKYTVGDIGVSYRNISHWGDVGILPDGVKEKGWKEFSELELVWLKIVQCLRDYGLSLDKILSVKSSVLKWDSKTDTYPIFERYVADTFSSNTDPYVVVFEDGTAKLANMAEIETPEIFPQIKHKLLISLRVLMKDKSPDGMRVAPNRLIMLMDEEKQLIEKLRSGGEIEIKVKTKHGRITSIQQLVIIKTYPTNPPLEEINKQLRQEKDFGEVITKYADGERQSAKIVRWTKLLKEQP